LLVLASKAIFGSRFARLMTVFFHLTALGVMQLHSNVSDGFWKLLYRFCIGDKSAVKPRLDKPYERCITHYGAAFRFIKISDNSLKTSWSLKEVMFNEEAHEKCFWQPFCHKNR
jgi:hypothetical protein